MRALISKLLALPVSVALLTMAACGGSAVVTTLTATPSSDSFIAYRVGLASVQLTKSGKAGSMVLPTETAVDFTKLFDFSEVLGVPGVVKGTYTGALITLDYSAAQIIYDDGSLEGVALTPVDAKGKALGLVTVGVTLDPGDPIISAAKQVGRLALDFNLAASNVVNLNARTVTITPMISASSLPIDANPVRIRGPILGSSSTFFASGVEPFDSAVAGLGQLSIEPSNVTTYEINGFVSTGTVGQAQLASLPANTLAQTFGTLSISTAGTATPAAATSPYTSPTSAGTTASVVSFTATQVLVDSSVQGLGIEILSGVVSARSGNTLGIEDATLTQNGGTVTFLPGTTIVNIGPNTLITAFGQGVAAAIGPQEISVGSSIEAFGTASQTSTASQTGTSGVLFDASAGRVRLDLTSAEGLVTGQGSAALTLNLTSLGGRSISAFDFTGSGAAPNQYGVATPGLDLTNAIVGAPVVVTGFPSAFGSTSPNYTASTLLDPTTIQAELVVDWSGGTAAPFTTLDSTAITLDANNSSIGARHQVQIGSQIVDIVGLSSGLTIAPTTTGSGMVFSIGHSASFTIESFDTYTAFITQLQSELSGALATGMTAVGQYTVSTSAFSASSITLFLDN
jgi:hypothetical protein